MCGSLCHALLLIFASICSANSSLRSVDSKTRASKILSTYAQKCIILKHMRLESKLSLSLKRTNKETSTNETKPTKPDQRPNQLNMRSQARAPARTRTRTRTRTCTRTNTQEINCAQCLHVHRSSGSRHDVFLSGWRGQN